jgi:hypothetical protein
MPLDIDSQLQLFHQFAVHRLFKAFACFDAASWETQQIRGSNEFRSPNNQ